MSQQPNYNGFIYLFKSIEGKTQSEIERILSNSQLINSYQKFVNFLNYINTLLSSSYDEKLFLLQLLLTICPSNVLSGFLSECNVSHRLLLLEYDIDTWIRYFIKLIEEGNQDEIFETLRELELYPHEEYQKYHQEIVFSLENQLRNPELEEEVRSHIFELIFSSYLIMIVVQNDLQIDREPTMRQRNDWIRRVSSELGFPITFLWHSQIDAISFVEATFQILESPHPKSICPICQFNPTDSDCCDTWRRLPCCGQQQCHNCLVRQVSLSNEYDVLNPSKPTDQLCCSLCKGIILFPE
jgi:hypothetical protein